MANRIRSRRVWQPKLEAMGTSTMGERGQVVIPSNVRKYAKIRAGDKLVVFVHPAGPLFMMPMRNMKGFVREMVKKFGAIKS